MSAIIFISQSWNSNNHKSLHLFITIPRPGKGRNSDSFIHSGHFYSASSSPLLLRGAPDYSTDTVSEFHAEVHRQLQVKDLPKVSTCMAINPSHFTKR